MLSAKNASLNMRFSHSTFKSKTKQKVKEVHGSFMTEAFVTLRTNGQPCHNITVGFQADRATKAEIHVDGRKDSHPGQRVSIYSGRGKPSFRLDNVIISLLPELSNSNQESAARLYELLGRAVLTIDNGAWRVTITSRRDSNLNTKKRLDLVLTPQASVDHDPVAPHGIIGQTFDRDNLAVIGKRDNYESDVVLTNAMAEGFIEGDASEYKMEDPFSTQFKYSRFDKLFAPPRNVSRLTGSKVARKGMGATLATTKAIGDM